MPVSICGGERWEEGNVAERGVGGKDAGGVVGNGDVAGEGTGELGQTGEEHWEGGEKGASGELFCEKTCWMSSKASAITSWRALRVANVDIGDAMDGAV